MPGVLAMTSLRLLGSVLLLMLIASVAEAKCAPQKITVFGSVVGDHLPFLKVKLIVQPEFRSSEVVAVVAADKTFAVHTSFFPERSGSLPLKCNVKPKRVTVELWDIHRRLIWVKLKSKRDFHRPNGRDYVLRKPVVFLIFPVVRNEAKD